MRPDWLGSPQHLVAGAVLTAIVIALMQRRIRPPWILAAFAIGVTAAAELAVELIEYPLLYSDDVNATAYLDTLADLAATGVGSLLAAGAGLALLRRRTRSGHP